MKHFIVCWLGRSSGLKSFRFCTFVIDFPTTQVCYSIGRLSEFYLFKEIPVIILLLITLSAGGKKMSESGSSSAWFVKVQRCRAWMAFKSGRAMPWCCGSDSDDDVPSGEKESLIWLQKKTHFTFVVVLIATGSHLACIFQPINCSVSWV